MDFCFLSCWSGTIIEKADVTYWVEVEGILRYIKAESDYLWTFFIYLVFGKQGLSVTCFLCTSIRLSSMSERRRTRSSVLNGLVREPDDPGGPVSGLTTDNNNRLSCHDCLNLFQISDIGMDRDMFLNILRLVNSGVRWHCSTCLRNPPQALSLQREMNDFKLIMKEQLCSISAQFNEQLDNFERSISSKLDQCHESSDTVKKSITTYASKVSLNIDKQGQTIEAMDKLAKKVDYIKQNVEEDLVSKSEAKLKEIKSQNIMLFRLPESDHEALNKAYQEDFNNVLDVIDPNNKLEKPDILELHRIPKVKTPTTQTPRPIVVKLKSVELRNRMLQLRNLKCSKNNELFPVYTAPDRTKKEQQIHKELVNELKRRKSQGETDLFIRNGKLVEKQPFRLRPQEYWGDRKTKTTNELSE